YFWKNFSHEVEHGIFVWMPVHGASEHQASCLWMNVCSRLKVFYVHTCGDRLDALSQVFISCIFDESPAVILGDGESQARLATSINLATPHFPPFHRKKEFSDKV